MDNNLLDMLVGMEVDDNTDQAQYKAARLATMPATCQATVHAFAQETSGLTFSNAEPPPGAIILNDLYKVYLCSALENRNISCLTVAKELLSLHTILLLVNHNLYVELILDPGSQVISMSEEACHVLGLIYDPLMSLASWYDSIPFHFRIFSISALTLTYHDAWNQRDASCKLREPMRSQARSMLDFR